MAKGLAPLIHDELGERNDNAQYSYSDLILNMSYPAFCGGDCAEDINYLYGKKHQINLHKRIQMQGGPKREINPILDIKIISKFVKKGIRTIH